ncbi:MAG TPA: hypothetical protein HA346_02260 [Thermoplasmata archaeon]|nr:hypothetical protein [Thermoplasmata archaeon]
MTKESDTLRIVKEDILRRLGEEKTEKIALGSIKSEINASDSFVSKAVKKLERESLIEQHNGLVSLTKKGEGSAKEVVKKHLVIENYFKEMRNGRDAHKVAHILEHYVSKEVIDNLKKISTLKREGAPLTEVEIGKGGIITDIISSDYRVFERMVSVGIFPGKKITLANKIPNGVVVRVKNKKFALYKSIAKRIRVTKQ